MTEPIELRAFKTCRRGKTVAECELVLGWLIIPGVKVCRNDERVYWVELPGNLRWKTRTAAERFRRATLSLIGHHHPTFFKHGLANAPLLHQADNSTVPEGGKNAG